MAEDLREKNSIKRTVNKKDCQKTVPKKATCKETQSGGERM